MQSTAPNEFGLDLSWNLNLLLAWPIAQDAQKDCPARPQGMTKDNPSKLACYLLSRGGLAWPPTAHVERPLLHRGGSVSTGDQPGPPS